MSKNIDTHLSNEQSNIDALLVTSKIFALTSLETTFNQ